MRLLYSMLGFGLFLLAPALAHGGGRVLRPASHLPAVSGSGVGGWVAGLLLLAALLLALWALLSLRRPRPGGFLALLTAALLAWLGVGQLTPPLFSALAANTPTYYQDLAPVLAENCTSCHVAGGIGPFDMNDVNEVKKRAQDILDWTSEGLMPPWKAGGRSPKLRFERKLSAQNKQLIANWVAAGAPLGDAATPAPLPKPKNIFPTPTLSLKVATPYTPISFRLDDYRCFLLDPKLTSDQMITAYRFSPGSASVVHHVFVYAIAPEDVAEAQLLEQKDKQSGWRCFGGIGIENNRVVGSWVPGVTGTVFPDKTGRQLKKGEQLAIQIHYSTAQGAKPDQSSLDLVLSGDKRLEILAERKIFAPVELRCSDAYAKIAGDPCRRGFSLGTTSASGSGLKKTIKTASDLLSRCRQRLEDLSSRPVGDASQQVMTCDYKIQRDGQLLGANLHMHLLGQNARLELNPDSKAPKVILEIPTWNFNWQGEYWLEQPMLLKRNDTVRVTCSYDNSEGNQPEIEGTQQKPRYVLWGEGTTDEMCEGFITFITQ
jgi:mono/diheme cytochrome c family protein